MTEALPPNPAPAATPPASPPSAPAPPASTRLSSDVPWPGLAPYQEADRLFFHGRSRESAELFRIVQRDPFVLLAGAAGVGKTSLLLAGLFPALREDSFLPVRVRLDWTDEERPLSAQVLESLAAAAKAEDVDGGQATEGDTLWEAFHRTGQRWWNPRQQVIVPVLVIDRAEELFTHGRESHRRRQRTDRLFEELAQLVENRAPARVATQLESGETQPGAFDFDAAPVRIVLSLREEALAQIRPLRGLFPSMGRSEQRLLPFSTAQAREAMAKPAAQNDLLSEGAADSIVRFLADGSGSEHPILPAHLSLLGRELALVRQQKGAGQISPDSLQSSPAQLVRDFYENALRGLPADAQRLIEDHLVTPEGQRIARPVEEATALPDITPDTLDTMADRCLLRFIPRRDGSRQIELMSGLLCPVAMQSRTTWALTVRDEAAGRDRAAFEQSTESLRSAAARQKKWALVFGILAALAIACAAVAGGFWLGTQRNLMKERALHSRQMQEALAAPLLAEPENTDPVIPAVLEPGPAAVATPPPATPAPAPAEPAEPGPESTPSVPAASELPSNPGNEPPSNPRPGEIRDSPDVAPESTPSVPPEPQPAAPTAKEKPAPSANEEIRRRDFLQNPPRNAPAPGAGARRAETANGIKRQDRPPSVRKPFAPTPFPAPSRPRAPGSPLR